MYVFFIIIIFRVNNVDLYTRWYQTERCNWIKIAQNWRDNEVWNNFREAKVGMDSWILTQTFQNRSTETDCKASEVSKRIVLEWSDQAWTRKWTPKFEIDVLQKKHRVLHYSGNYRSINESYDDWSEQCHCQFRYVLWSNTQKQCYFIQYWISEINIGGKWIDYNHLSNGKVFLGNK